MGVPSTYTQCMDWLCQVGYHCACTIIYTFITVLDNAIFGILLHGMDPHTHMNWLGLLFLPSHFD